MMIPTRWNADFLFLVRKLWETLEVGVWCPLFLPRQFQRLGKDIVFEEIEVEFSLWLFHFGRTIYKTRLLHFSLKSKEVWNRLCNRGIGYVVVAALWILPTILTGFPKYFEPNVKYKPGQGKELGYMCYPVEVRNKNETMTWFTERQYGLNMFNDISLLLIMVSSISLIWYNFEKEAKDIKNRQSTDFGKEILGELEKSRKRSFIRSSIMICAPYIFLRLPIFIYGRTETTNLPVGLGGCSLLYELQFCIHFVFYAFIHKDYQLAYKELFNNLFSKCVKSPTYINSVNTPWLDEVHRNDSTSSVVRWKFDQKLPKNVRFTLLYHRSIMNLFSL